MARKKYITSHSNYVIKQEHTKTSNGTIYERDYTTLTPLNTFASNQMVIYGDGNFKLSVGSNSNKRVKHNYGEWEEWNPSLVSDEISSEGKILLKPNYSSLLDFAYYGSCVSLIESSIYDIIKKYPAELYFSDRQVLLIDENEDTVFLGGSNRYVVENPFKIECINIGFEKDDIRSIPINYSKYVFINGNDNTINKAIKGYDYEMFSHSRCYKNNEHVGNVKITLIDNKTIMLYVYFYQGEYYLLYEHSEDTPFSSHLRLNHNEIEKAFSDMDDFEKILLNRESKPLYKARLDTPEETPQGFVTSKKNYIWPTIGGWNLDISSSNYSNYVNSLYEIANFYDEYYTDNAWRRLTHTAIKNMDMSYESLKKNENYEDYMAGNGRLETIIKAYARQYDDIKRYINNIKLINNVTYDRKNNIPDYFLSDSLNLYGWDVINVMPTQRKEVLSDILYNKTENKRYNSTDANIEFLRRLKLNSKYLLSLKGTKLGIETILKLFGLTNNDFYINEYVAIANANRYCTPENIKKYNSYKNGYIGDYELEGLPIKEVILIDEDDNTKSYLIPWFDKSLAYDGGMYYQMNGGWGKSNSKKINNTITDINILRDENGELSIYDESVKYLHYIGTLEELKNLSLLNLSEGDIYYVRNISDLGMIYNEYSVEDGLLVLNPNNFEDFSNYFVLKDMNYSYLVGNEVVNNEIKYGWMNIKKSDLKNGTTPDAKKVIYLESIIEDSKSNAPHTGFGYYDDGEEYLDYFRQIFKYSVESADRMFDSNAYSCDNGEILDEIVNAGFDISKQFDNIKCWYFTNTNSSSEKLYELNYNINTDTYVSTNENDVIYVGNNLDSSLYNSNIAPINPENVFQSDDSPLLPSYDEAAANSIINIKNMDIIIKRNDNEFIDYFNEKILPYVKQMIPSTTIWNIRFENNESED